MVTQTVERFETVIIGGGQAGLAAGYHLQKRGRSFVILDAGERVGDSWRKRWPSLRLYSPARVDGLPGMRFPAPAQSFPTAGEMANYLEAYAERFDLPVRTGIGVDAVEKDGDGYVVRAGDRRFEADNVVAATGVFQHDRPVTPDFAPGLDPGIRQLHSADYRSPAQLQPGPTLVVGAAHSGGDIALEVALAGHRTILSGPDTGQIPHKVIMSRVLGPLVKFVATRVLTVSTPMGRRAKTESRSHGGPLLRVKRADLEAAGVERVFERTVGVDSGKPVLADGRVVEATNVIWCTGFRNDYTWIRFPLPLEDGWYPIQVEAPFHPLPASTSSDCPSFTPSARCSFSEPGEMQNASSGTSCPVRPSARVRRPSRAPPWPRDRARAGRRWRAAGRGL